MSRLFLIIAFFVGILSGVLLALPTIQAGAKKPVRVAVIGGMTMTPLWGELQKRFLATYDGGVGDGIPIFIPVNQPR
jgi:hypothetical protein